MPSASLKYDLNIIYNKANAPISKTDDTELSLRFTKCLDEHLTKWGFKSYYHERDALPGRNIFKQLQVTVDSSRYTAVILTKGFIKNCWTQYMQQSAFKKLLDKDEIHRLIPIAVGLSEQDLEPTHLNIQEVLYFQETWSESTDTERWMKIKKVLEEDGTVSERTFHAEEIGDNRKRTDTGNLVVQVSEPNKEILDSCYKKLLEDMDADSVIDHLVGKKIFQHSTLRSIREENFAERNRELIELIRAKDWDAYEVFKDCLEKSSQSNLAKDLEKEEQKLGIRDAVDSRTVVPTSPSDDSLDSLEPGSVYMDSPSSLSLDSQEDPVPPLSAELIYKRTDSSMSQDVERIIPDVQGALHTAGQGTAGPQTKHTTNMTRQIVSGRAVIDLQTDGSLSSSSAGMALESGPKLSLPTKKPPAQSSIQNTSAQPSEASGQLQKTEQSKQMNTPQGTLLSGAGAVKTSTPAVEVISPENVPSLQQQRSLSQDQDLVVDSMPSNQSSVVDGESLTESGLSLASLAASDDPTNQSSSDCNAAGLDVRRGDSAELKLKPAPSVRTEADGQEVDTDQTGRSNDDTQEPSVEQVNMSRPPLDTSDVRRETEDVELGQTEPGSSYWQGTSTDCNQEDMETKPSPERATTSPNSNPS